MCAVQSVVLHSNAAACMVDAVERLLSTPQWPESSEKPGRSDKKRVQQISDWPVRALTTHASVSWPRGGMVHCRYRAVAAWTGCMAYTDTASCHCSPQLMTSSH